MSTNEQQAPSPRTDPQDHGSQQSRGSIGDAGNSDVDRNGKKSIPTKAAAAKDKLKIPKEKAKEKQKPAPAGGWSDTPIPHAQDGYTVKFTFHGATNLVVADFGSRSSDPYIKARLTAPGITKRHKEDPDMILRTETVHKSTTPEWNAQWIVAGIPSSGFSLKCRLYDEDPSDHDDRLGNVTVHASNLASWQGLKEEEFHIKKRMGSKRAYAVRGCLAMLSSSVKMDGKLYLSAEVLGKSDPPHGRMYTLGQLRWFKHYSPMIGRIAGTKNFESGPDGQGGKVERYDFQANQFQLEGPVPAKLYHRFVEFKPFVKGMFSGLGLRGRVLNKALHHQYARVYNFSSTTKTGIVQPRSEEATLKFIDMAHYDEGGRIFTYVITVDGLFRFTETGKEFGIDLLSKHTMHSDVNIYIACSGEFFIRRLAKPEASPTAPDQETHPAQNIPHGPPDDPPPKVAKDYELIIDNDSGTYRPKGDLLPELSTFLGRNLPGLHIVTKECTDEELGRWKDEQRKTKKKQGRDLVVVQNSDDEVSSDDESALDHRIQGHQSKSSKAFTALEDPLSMAKNMIPGEKGRKEREARETEDDVAAEAA
ncbi:MAG: hypothetical protein M1818_006881 [Claussenomyces sp. TS43310]|nr:MAG: hypothetical protein M1818_006881 [Claussenomyces sp. TS43310]